MIIRPLRADEADGCVVLGGAQVHLSATQYAQEISAPGRHWLAAELDGHLVGFAGTWDAPDGCHLLAIAVDPVHRRHGIATALLDRLLDDAGARDAGPVTLEVRADSAAAIALYESRGFCEAGRRPHYYQDADAIIMSRPPAIAPGGR